MKYLIDRAAFLGERLLTFLQGKGYGSFSTEYEVAALSRLLDRPIRLAVDVGANKGLYTDAVLSRFPEAEVHLFEPSKRNVEHLNDKYKSNDNVIVNKKALSSNAGVSLLYSDVEGSGLASLVKRDLQHKNISFVFEEPVETERFDRYFFEVLRGKDVDLLKIDVEGHELEVLRGCGEALKSIICIQFEFGGCNIDTRTYFRDFWLFLCNLGYEIYRISPFGAIKVQRYVEQHEYFVTTNYFAIRRKPSVL